MERSLLLLCILLPAIGISQTITRAEYFFDADPGRGSGKPIAVVPGAQVSLNFSVATNTLTTGFHTLNVRVKDNGTAWSLFASRTFFIQNVNAFITASEIVKAEYFIDSDPGRGSGVDVPITAAATISPNIAIDISSLSPGFHNFNFRVKDDKGRWSLFLERIFYITPIPSSSGTSNLVEAEYFMDTDPGTGNGTTLPITTSVTQNNTFNINLGSMTPGFHRFAIRYRDNLGRWSHFKHQTFYITPPNTLPASDLEKIEYYIDTDPGYDQGTNLLSVPAPSVDAVLPIGLSGVPPGNHVLYMRAKDSQGFWSGIIIAPFVIQNCVPPNAPVATGASRCGPGTLTLSATGASGLQEYRWYADPTTSSITATGSSFTTPSLSANKSYYVAVYDPGTTCESDRAIVVAGVSVISKPSLNVIGSLSFCEGNSIFLNAPNGFANYQWSDGRTTQQISVVTGGDYSVKTGDATGCFSASSDTVSITVIPAPAKPAINVTGSTILCGTETAQLSAPAGFTYLWSTGETSQDIAVAADGNYAVSVRNATGCQSVSSDAVVITRITDEAIISQDGNILIASVGQQYQWYLNDIAIAGAQGQTLEISVGEFGVYNVEVTTGSCFRRSDDYFYQVTVNEPNAREEFIIAPNPITTTLKTNNQLSENVEMMVVDALGKIILQEIVTPGKHEYDVSATNAGIYYVLSKTKNHSKVFKIYKL
jgi:hypothetical protein